MPKYPDVWGHMGVSKNAKKTNLTNEETNIDINNILLVYE